jgi:diguanylate cyclase (GGDEF)-like protein
MTADQIENVDERRFIEIDSVLKRLNMTTAIVVAGAAVLFFGRFGAGFLAFASLPMLWWIGRRVLGLQRRIGLRRWNVGLIMTMIASIVGGAATSGGLTSPVIFFAGLVGMLAHATFPNFRYSRVSGLFAIAMIACIDIVRGQPIESFSFIAAAVIAGYLPLIVRQLVEVEQIQRRSAVLDVLTGCLNRRSFEQRSAEIDAQARCTGATVAVISLDIDHFKAVNDKWGHAAGDQVLANVAYVARKQLRRFELMFRLGGEEFVVVLPDTEAKAAMAIAKRLRRSVETTSSGGIRVTSSLGVAVGSNGIERVLAQADERLYTAKKSGRNCVIGPDMTQIAEHTGTSNSPGVAATI